MKHLVWFMGGMACGKSTLRRLMTQVLADKPKTYIIEEGIEVSSFGRLGVPGYVTDNSACDGMDRSFGKLKKEGAIASAKRSILEHEITILEGSQTSIMWMQPMIDFCKENNCKFTVILIDVPLWINYNRLLKRIIKRGGSEADMTDARVENVRSKNKQYGNIFLKCEATGEINCYRLNTLDRTDEEKILDCLQGIGITDI